MTRRVAFTLVELLVVIAIIVALLAILLPSMGRAIEVANRAVCLSNQRQISIASQSYVTDNFGAYLFCGTRQVQISFYFGYDVYYPEDTQVNPLAEWTSRGIMHKDNSGTYTPSKVWNCPSRDFVSGHEGVIDQVTVGYQYMGGVIQWENPFGIFDANSPVRASTSKGDWVLLADTSGKIDGAWGAGRTSAYGGMPSHRASDGPWPEGHNQLYVDGSGSWSQGEDLIYVHSWSGDQSRVYFMDQHDLNGWSPPAALYLEAYK